MANQAPHRCTLTFALDKKLKAQIQRESKRQGISMGQMICLIIADGIAEQKQFHAMMAHPQIRKNLISLFANPESMHAVADVMKLAMSPEKTQQQLLDFMENYNAPGT